MAFAIYYLKQSDEIFILQTELVLKLRNRVWV